MTAVDELAALQERRAALREHVVDMERRMTFASADVERARQAIGEAERRRLRGDGSAEDVTKAEKNLAKAKQTALGDATREKVQGGKDALRDLDAQIGTFAGDNYPALRDAANEQAVAAAEHVDRALQELIAAFGAREHISQTSSELFALVARPDPNTIPRSSPSVERAVNAAAEALAEGGERPPVLPDSYLPPEAQQDHATIAPVEEEVW